MTRFALETLHLEAQRAIASEGLRPFTRRTGLAMGVARSLTDGRDMSVSNTLAVAEALGYEIFAQPKRFKDGFSEPQTDSDLAATSALRGGYLPIPWHDKAGLVGSAPIAFSATWLASEGISPDNLRAVAPTLVNFFGGDPKNTVALLDTTAPQEGDQGQWCYLSESTIGVCRVSFHGDVFVLLAGGPDGPIRLVNRVAPGDVQLLGRVVWIGGLVPPS